jgi:hypothetical protein
MDNNKKKVIKSTMYKIKVQLGALKKTLIPYLIELNPYSMWENGYLKIKLGLQNGSNYFIISDFFSLK